MKIPKLKRLDFPEYIADTYPNLFEELSEYDSFINELTNNKNYSQQEIKQVQSVLEKIRAYHSEVFASYVHLDPDCIYDPAEDDPVLCRMHTKQIIHHAHDNLSKWKQELNKYLLDHPSYDRMKQIYNQLEKSVNFATREVQQVIPETRKLKKFSIFNKPSANKQKPSPSETLAQLKTKKSSLEKRLEFISSQKEEQLGRINKSSEKLSNYRYEKQHLPELMDRTLSSIKQLQFEMSTLDKQIDNSQSKEEQTSLEIEHKRIERKLSQARLYYSHLEELNSRLSMFKKDNLTVDPYEINLETGIMAQENDLMSIDREIDSCKDELHDVLIDILTIRSVRLLLRQERARLKDVLNRQKAKETESSPDAGDPQLC